MDAIAEAIAVSMTAHNLLFLVFGVVLGVVVGAIPGLNGPMAIALCVPLTFFMPAVSAIGFLVGINKGGSFGGAISAILLNTPGTPEATATSWDGHPLARAGKAAKAMKVALYASVLGDTFSDIVLILVAAPIAVVALRMGPPEICAVVIFSMTIIAGIETSSITKGLIAAALGMLVSTVGTDPATATPRLAFGVYQLEAGIPLMAICIGMLALSEIIIHAQNLHFGGEAGWTRQVQQSSRPEDSGVSWDEWKSCLPTCFRSAVIGTVVGALPGLGTTVAAFLGYSAAKRASKHPETFGKGALEGIAAAESANNAVVGANFIPLFTLGIPGNLAAALLAGAFIIHGITPGPEMFEKNSVLIYGIYVSMLIANVLNLGMGRLAIRCSLLLLNVPIAYIYSSIVLLCMTGAYIESYSIFAVFLMLLFSILGFFMKVFDFSFVTFIIGYVLGPMFEISFQQTLVMSGNNSIMLLFTRPIACVCMIMTGIVVLRSILRYKKNETKNAEKSGNGAADVSHP